ncbi:hypothetical protein TNIN_203291 [Trichonephila inaurata madagascariensis]|uniref:Uncharacterized protein n=1 Tax=Trichonephila inaurata madagascariensis TaxID=2747483 RepID=A0A8X6X049_9ARAC|nr:hypothetical protein TNIN_203291 [Trichonephila inaurata madagascariensis]
MYDADRHQEVEPLKRSGLEVSLVSVVQPRDRPRKKESVTRHFPIWKDSRQNIPDREVNHSREEETKAHVTQRRRISRLPSRSRAFHAAAETEG